MTKTTAHFVPLRQGGRAKRRGVDKPKSLIIVMMIIALFLNRQKDGFISA